MICLLAMAHVEKLGSFHVCKFVVIVSLVKLMIYHLGSYDLEGWSDKVNMS